VPPSCLRAAGEGLAYPAGRALRARSTQRQVRWGCPAAGVQARGPL